MVDVQTLRFAYAHDWLISMRGGEYVLERIIAQLGPGPLYTLVASGAPMARAIDACAVRRSFLQKIPGGAGRLRRWLLPLMPLAVERMRVEPCDVLISTSSCVIHGLAPPPGARHLCYCHSPARYLWEQTPDYATGSLAGLRALGLRLARRRFQRWDRATAGRADRFLANSAHTARRIQRCFGRDARVVHPPVRTELFTHDPQVAREDWLLLVAALEPYKRTDLAIDAANRAKLPLKIVGTGSQSRALARRAGPTIEILGRVDDATLRSLYQRARALLFPQEEDFGIVAAEALATGCPVIARAAGGAVEIVDETTGVLFDEPTPEAIIQAINVFEGRSIDPAACRARAEQFSEAAFDAALRREVEALVAG